MSCVSLCSGLLVTPGVGRRCRVIPIACLLRAFLLSLSLSLFLFLRSHTARVLLEHVRGRGRARGRASCVGSDVERSVRRVSTKPVFDLLFSVTRSRLSCLASRCRSAAQRLKPYANAIRISTIGNKNHKQLNIGRSR